MNLHPVVTVNGEQWSFNDSNGTQYNVCWNPALPEVVSLWVSEPITRGWRRLGSPYLRGTVLETAQYFQSLFDGSLGGVD